MGYTKPRATCQGCGKPATPGARYCARCAQKRRLGSLTPEQRSTHALCGAKTRSGGTCRLYAGQGTNHKGVGACKLHGGNTPAHEAKAVALLHQRDMVRFGQPIAHLKPNQALLGILRATAGHTAYLHAEIQRLDDLASPEAKVLLQLYGSERDRLTTIAGTCLRAGMPRVQIEIRDAVLGHVLDAVTRACEAAGFDDEMRQELGRQLKLATTELAEQFPAPDLDGVSLWEAALDDE